MDYSIPSPERMISLAMLRSASWLDTKSQSPRRIESIKLLRRVFGDNGCSVGVGWDGVIERGNDQGWEMVEWGEVGQIEVKSAR